MRRPLLILMNGAFALGFIRLGAFLYDPIGAGLHTMFVPELVLVALGLVHAWYIERIPLMRSRIGGPVRLPRRWRSGSW